MMLNRFFKYFFSTLLVSVVLTLFAGCSSDKDELKTLRIGMNTWPGYEPFMLAKDRGFLNENILISRVDSATDVIKAFKSDIVDVACITLDEAMLLQDSMKESVKIITIIDFSHGADVIIAKKHIKSMKELKDKRVGVEASALGLFMISRAVDLTPELYFNDINIVNLGYEHHEEEFNAGNIDAVVTFEPIKTRLLKDGAHVIFNSKQIPGEIMDVMVVKEKIIKSQENNLQKLVDGWYKAVDEISKNRDSTMKSMAQYEKVDKKEFEIAYKSIKVLSRGENKLYYENNLDKVIIKVQKLLQKKNIIKNNIVPNKLYSNKFIKG